MILQNVNTGTRVERVAYSDFIQSPVEGRVQDVSRHARTRSTAK
jgi:hypothetical protein